jgi:uncharacterized protein (DUF885 family)
MRARRPIVSGMSRNRSRAPRIHALALAVVGALAWLGDATLAARLRAEPGAPQAAAAAAPAGDAAFRKTVNAFIDSELRLFPQRATAEGDHRFDDRVNDRSAAGIAAVVRHAEKWKQSFATADPKTLSPANEADREWLIAQLDGELLDTQEIRTYERDPGMYLPTSAVHALIKRNFAPAAVRMRSVTARETAALRNLAAARVNLKPNRTPKVAIDIVLEQAPATLDFFRKDLPRAFASVPDGASKRGFEKANATLVAAIDGYDAWLKDDLRRKATGKYAIGADAYRRMLADEDMVDIPLDRLERAGVRELARLQDEFRKTAAKIDPHRSPAEVAAAIAREHPSTDRVIPEVRDGLAALRAFVVVHHIATIPSQVPPIVRETPPYMRATTFASMDTPGPFEKSTEAYYQVTLPDPSWSKAKQDQLLAFFSPPTISDTSVHEVYPGHYVQFLNNRLNPDLVRSLYYSGANAEGWALYCEQMMLDEGLHRGHPEYRLAQLQMALLRACRYLVGLRMHTRAMTVDEAMRFFEQNAYQNQHNAMVEALRGSEDPGYLRYQLGKLMILKLREDVRRKQGAAFDLGRFHDAFLREGALPLRLIRRAMLGSDGPLL